MKITIYNIIQISVLGLINHLSRFKTITLIPTLILGFIISLNFIESQFMNIKLMGSLSNILFSAFSLTFLSTYFYIKKNQIKFKQPISKFIKKHKVKCNIPTLGGIIILFSFLFHSLILSSYITFSKYDYFILLTTLLFGLIGLYDDYRKLYYKNNLGLNAKNKLLLQIFLSLFVMILLKLNISYFAMMWWTFVIVSSSNAVNLTDGLDGLAGSTCIIAMLFPIVFSLYFNSIVFLLLMIICVIAFLNFNQYPAKVFMGDVGSMSLGAFIATNYLIINQEWMLILTGCIFVLETLSVIIQIISIKLFNRKIFIIAPIHHHFEHYYHEKTVSRIFIYFMISINVVVILWKIKFISF